MDTRPYYRRSPPKPQNPGAWLAPDGHLLKDGIDFDAQHLPLYPTAGPSGMADARPLANAYFDSRAAAAVCAKVGSLNSLRMTPDPKYKNFLGVLDLDALLEVKDYGNSGAGVISILTNKCLAVMAFPDYFPGLANLADGRSLRGMVSEAIMMASAGWCGQFGPDVTSEGGGAYEGNYDMTEMFILPLVYSYYDELTPAAQQKVIASLLEQARIHRASIDGVNDARTSGKTPDDWYRAGYVSAAFTGWTNLDDLPETENHVLMIAAARYLTNQLLYQIDHDPNHDNRRNGCTDQLRGLLRNQLRNDFAEYNAKNYQEETRHALLNLCTYAYEGEVSLGARMVLDYISAHIAVSSSDLRRMVPFRRRNELAKVQQLAGEQGFMDISLLGRDLDGADPMSAQFALLAGNTRAYNTLGWIITPNFAEELTLGAVCNYRLPPSIHDLFVNDLHRRFFQRLHRRQLFEEPGGQRNCDNMEIYCGSPSYLITAGGRPAEWVIPGKQGHGYEAQNLGVAMPTSFIPTGLSAGTVTNDARDVIQLSRFSDQWADPSGDQKYGGSENYGVAPDFACGFGFHLPTWTGVPGQDGGPFFANKESHGEELAGFFLAIYKSGDFVLMEAFDTWLHPEVSFEQFQRHVSADNPNVQFNSGRAGLYKTYYGNQIHFVIWNNLERDNHKFGAKILSIEYAEGHAADTLADAGNYTPYVDEYQFLSGSILKSVADGVIEIHNPFLAPPTKITLDWSDPAHPMRTSEVGEVEQGGAGYEVWVDFAWTGPSEGDFFRPFKTIASAVEAVADRGVIKILPGTTSERPTIQHNKRVRLVAPYGRVSIGVH